MSERNDLISVIIPAYNADNYLAEAIDSVLAQTYRPLEVIVVDDGSTDQTATVAARFGDQVRYDSQPHRGLAATLNRGVELAQAHWLAFLDADDIWMPEKLERQLAVFKANTDVEAVFSYLQCFLSPEVLPELAQRLRFNPDPMPGVFKGALVIRTDAFQRVGPFNTALTVGDFVEWYARAMELGLKVEMLPDVLYKRRVHADNMSNRERDSRGDYVRIAKARLDQRRKTPNDSKPG